jgi:hypothetical protein
MSAVPPPRTPPADFAGRSRIFPDFLPFPDFLAFARVLFFTGFRAIAVPPRVLDHRPGLLLCPSPGVSVSPPNVFATRVIPMAARCGRRRATVASGPTSRCFVFDGFSAWRCHFRYCVDPIAFCCVMALESYLKAVEPSWLVKFNDPPFTDAALLVPTDFAGRSRTFPDFLAFAPPAFFTDFFAGFFAGFFAISSSSSGVDLDVLVVHSFDFVFLSGAGRPTS